MPRMTREIGLVVAMGKPDGERVRGLWLAHSGEARLKMGCSRHLLAQLDGAGIGAGQAPTGDAC